MTVNPLPPQAYTKETLQKAYTWLLTQSPSVKDMATSQDMLVSLYLKAQRNGDAALETPSIQNFKQELKSLAGLMGDLQNPQTSATATKSPMPQSFVQASAPAQTQASPIMNTTVGLDEQSVKALQDVKNSLNLSSDAEALRALIALGYRQFKKIES